MKKKVGRLYDVIFYTSQKCLKFKLKLDLYFFSKYSQEIRFICHKMAIEFIKVHLTDHTELP